MTQNKEMTEHYDFSISEFPLTQLNPIMDGVRETPIMDGGGGQKSPPPSLTLPFGVGQQ